MKGLILWVIECSNDSSAYDIRETTKRAALARLYSFENDDDIASNYHKKLTKYELTYDSPFHLLDSCLGEEGFNALVTSRTDYRIFPKADGYSATTIEGWSK